MDRILIRTVAALACGLGALWAGVPDPAAAAGTGAAETAPAADGRDLVIRAMSRGQGVPENAWTAVMAARAWLLAAQAQGRVLSIRDEVVGLEGEIRICVRFRTPEFAGAALAALAPVFAEIDLATVSRGVCPADPGGVPLPQ